MCFYFEISHICLFYNFVCRRPVRCRYLIALLEVSGSWAETLPIEVPTLASSETTILLSGVEKTGGSFTSCTVTLTDVVSLNGPKLKKLESIFLFVASILREKLLFVSKSNGWRRGETARIHKTGDGLYLSKHERWLKCFSLGMQRFFSTLSNVKEQVMYMFLTVLRY